MSKTQKILFGVFVAVVLLLTFLEATEPEPVNWNPSYSENDKIPLGTFVLFENLKKLHGAEITEVNRPPYEQLISEDFSGTYLFINEYVGFDEAELEEMLNWVQKGNTLFVSARYVGNSLLDTLNLERELSYSTETINSKPLLELANPSFKAEKGYLFDREHEIFVFEKIDTLNSTVLGFAQPYKEDQATENPEVNFISSNFGEGKIFLHFAPEAFSNYFLLSENNIQYTEAALSYLDLNQKIYWDSYYKAGKTFYTSPLYILLNSKKLKWAYYFLILGCVLFVLFEGKRKQRSIPVVKPLSNQTYNYTRTIAGLYFERKQYVEIASKKIKLFFEYIRTQLRVNTLKFDENFYETVASRSGNTVEDTKALFEYIAATQSKEKITKADLLKLTKQINSFKNK